MRLSHELLDILNQLDTGSVGLSLGLGYLANFDMICRRVKL